MHAYVSTFEQEKKFKVLSWGPKMKAEVSTFKQKTFKVPS